MVMSDQKKKVSGTNDQTVFLLSGGWAYPYARTRMRSLGTQAKLGVEPLLLFTKRSQLRWLGHLFGMPSRHLAAEVFWVCPTNGGLREGLGHNEGSISFSWPGVLPYELKEVTRARDI